MKEKTPPEIKTIKSHKYQATKAKALRLGWQPASVTGVVQLAAALSKRKDFQIYSFQTAQR